MAGHQVVEVVEGQGQHPAQQGTDGAVDAAVEPAPQAGAHAEHGADAGEAGVAVQQVIAGDDDGRRQDRQPQLGVDALAPGDIRVERQQIVHRMTLRLGIDGKT